ncbi:hypothetical protein Oweho_0851 [Owenweeksia hongkongensis DSM 17368]|uniref:Uncharacterized protein n=1 Tax=Owenweeksia hongkongensis (strain DSM 17368 / CIP 108786 / JCM 12287 / NRRL B-23963 / UST20020801) TaxID=926562 RepID=G8R2Q8_OWEHD|nr:hypothetical protein Oweho_0851 [Owenweeksia hongkongensis DSM 17368]
MENWKYIFLGVGCLVFGIVQYILSKRKERESEDGYDRLYSIRVNGAAVGAIILGIYLLFWEVLLK